MVFGVGGRRRRDFDCFFKEFGEELEGLECLEGWLVGSRLVVWKKVKKVVFCCFWCCWTRMPDRKLDWEEWEVVRENFQRFPSKEQYLKVGEMVRSCWREKYKTDVCVFWESRFFEKKNIFCFPKSRFFSFFASVSQSEFENFSRFLLVFFKMVNEKPEY